MARSSSPTLAGSLSALLPGLGQLYNRHYAKGAACLGAMLVLDAALGLSADTLNLLQAAVTGTAPPAVPSLLLRMLPVLGLAVWSIRDAARCAGKDRPSSSSSPASVPR